MRGPTICTTACLAVTCAAAIGAAAAGGVGLAQAQTAQRQGAQAPICGADEIARATVRRVEDARTLALADGREVRLAGIEAPPLPSPQNITGPPGGAAAKDALAAQVEGREVVLRRAEIAADRYGRVVAYLYTSRAGDEAFVQGELVAGGFARVGDRVGSPACASALLQQEQAARRARLGLWANPYYAVLDAGAPADMLAQKGRFALVEGQVASVRESGATIYVNFGRRWSEGFAVTVLKRNERSFAAAGVDLRRLAGRQVLVRGYIETRGTVSPRIEAERPEQIKTADRD